MDDSGTCASLRARSACTGRPPRSVDEIVLAGARGRRAHARTRRDAPRGACDPGSSRTQAPQRRRGAVAQVRAVVLDRSTELRRERAENRVDAAAIVASPRRRMPRALPARREPSRSTGRRSDQRRRVEHAATPARSAAASSRSATPASSGSAVVLEQGDRFARQGLPPDHLAGVLGRREHERPRLAGRALGEA